MFGNIIKLQPVVIGPQSLLTNDVVDASLDLLDGNKKGGVYLLPCADSLNRAGDFLQQFLTQYANGSYGNVPLKRILMPILKDTNHYVWFAIDVEENQALYMDSHDGAIPIEITNTVKKLSEQKMLNEYKLANASRQQQKAGDTRNCGVFVLLNHDKLADTKLSLAELANNKDQHFKDYSEDELIAKRQLITTTLQKAGHPVSYATDEFLTQQVAKCLYQLKQYIVHYYADPISVYKFVLKTIKSGETDLFHIQLLMQAKTEFKQRENVLASKNDGMFLQSIQAVNESPSALNKLVAMVKEQWQVVSKKPKEIISRAKTQIQEAYRQINDSLWDLAGRKDTTKEQFEQAFDKAVIHYQQLDVDEKLYLQSHRFFKPCSLEAQETEEMDFKDTGLTSFC